MASSRVVAQMLLFSKNEVGALRLMAKVADFGLAIGISGTSTAMATSRTHTHAAGVGLLGSKPQPLATADGSSRVVATSTVWSVLTCCYDEV